MQRFSRVAGVLVEPVGHLWAAFSPVTGDTTLINDESAAILEILELGPAISDSVCANLAADSGLPVKSLVGLVESGWSHLIEAGLVSVSTRS